MTTPLYIQLMVSYYFTTVAGMNDFQKILKIEGFESPKDLAEFKKFSKIFE
jgi:hypothetical protein